MPPSKLIEPEVAVDDVGSDTLSVPAAPLPAADVVLATTDELTRHLQAVVGALETGKHDEARDRLVAASRLNTTEVLLAFPITTEALQNESELLRETATAIQLSKIEVDNEIFA